VVAPLVVVGAAVVVGAGVVVGQGSHVPLQGMVKPEPTVLTGSSSPQFGRPEGSGQLEQGSGQVSDTSVKTPAVKTW